MDRAPEYVFVIVPLMVGVACQVEDIFEAFFGLVELLFSEEKVLVVEAVDGDYELSYIKASEKIQLLPQILSKHFPLHIQTLGCHLSTMEYQDPKICLECAILEFRSVKRSEPSMICLEVNASNVLVVDVFVDAGEPPRGRVLVS